MRLFTLDVHYSSGEKCVSIHTSFEELVQVVKQVIDDYYDAEGEFLEEELYGELEESDQHWFELSDGTNFEIQEHSGTTINRLRQVFLDENPKKFLFEWMQENDMECWEQRYCVIDAETEDEAWKEFYGQWIDIEDEEPDTDLAELFEREYTYIQEMTSRQI